MIYLGLDVGTTRIKTVAYDDAAGRTVASAAVDTPVAQREHGAVHEPDVLYDAVLRCLHAVADECSAAGRAGEIAAICAVSLAEEVVLLSGDGAPVFDAPVWYQPRGAGYVAEYVTGRDRTAATNAAFSLFTLRWIADCSPGARAQAARFTDPGSFVLSRLAGRGRCVVMDHSHASRTGAFDLTDRRFDAEALEWAGNWAAAAPELVASGTPIGTLDAELAARLGLDPRVQIISGAHDHFAAAFACGVRRPGDAMVSTGTAEAQLVLTDSVPEPGGLPVDVGCFVDDGTFYAHRGLPGGRVFASWRRLLGADGPLRDAWFTPPPRPDRALAPARCSIDAERATASFADLPLDVEPDDVLRCVSEGLAVHARDSLTLLERVTGTPVGPITVAGPAATHAGWRRLRATILQCDLRVVVTPEPSALGAALLAQRALTGAADTPTEVVDVPAVDLPPYYRRLIDAYHDAAPGEDTR